MEEKAAVPSSMVQEVLAIPGAPATTLAMVRNVRTDRLA